ncbi:MAG: ribonuclease HII [Patescibacteria group bacterium]
MLKSNLEQDLLLKYPNIIGIDEVGRGPLAGPVIMAGYKLLYNTKINPGVNDSKKLSKVKREVLNNFLKKEGSYYISIISNDYIDEFGISSAIVKGINEIIINLNPRYTLIDGYFKEKFDTDYSMVVKGDQTHYSIASASIIAKVKRDEIMDEYSRIYPNYEFEKNVGYGTKKHIELIRSNGICAIHRKSFLKNYI